MNESIDDIQARISRHEISEVLGCSIGSLSFGSAVTTAFSEVLVSQPDRYLVAGSLAALSALALAKSTLASRQIPKLQTELRALEQPSQLNVV